MRTGSYEERRYTSRGQKRVDRRERRILAGFLEEAGCQGLVLDLPCGYGRMGDLISETGARVVHADLDPKRVRRARQQHPESQGFVVCDATGIPFRDGALRGIVAIRLLQHMPDKEVLEAVLAEMARVSSGFLLVSYYSRAALHRFQRPLRRMLWRRMKRHVLMVDDRELEKLARRQGLSLVRRRRLLPGIHAQTFALFRPSPR
jgi:ubiquinone/menaquinone biosynthesis C-methylase UbiE